MEDKKKILMLGALLVVMLGVGAFQVMQPAAPAPTAEKIEPKGKEGETKLASRQEGEGEPGAEKAEPTVPEFDPALVQVVQLEHRDPFDGRKWAEAGISGMPKPETHTPKVQQSVQNANQYSGQQRSGARSMPEIPPMQIGGNLEPTLPGVNQGGGMQTGAPTGAVAGGTMPSFEDVPYQVSGVVSGKRQAAVFKDSSGNQRLVRVGDKLDDDTVVTGVSRGKVVVKRHGKTKVLNVEYGQGDKGTPNEPH